jgi:hypothetical protein
VIGVGFLAIGVVFLYVWRKHQHEPFFIRRREVAPPGFLDKEDTPKAPPPAFAEGGAE